MIKDSVYERDLTGDEAHVLSIPFNGEAGVLYRLEAKVFFNVSKDAVGEILYEFEANDLGNASDGFKSVGSEHIFDTQLKTVNRTFEFSQRFNFTGDGNADFKISLEGNIPGPINVDLYLYDDGLGDAAPEAGLPDFPSIDPPIEPPVNEMTIIDSWVSGERRLNFEMDEDVIHPSNDTIAANGFKVEGYVCDRVKVSNSNNNVLWVYVTGTLSAGPNIVTYTKADCSEPVQSVTGRDFPEGESDVT